MNKNTTVITESPLLGRGKGEAPTAMSASSLPLGEGGGRGPQSIKNREAFFDYLEEGLQSYFDNHDRLFGGIIHLTVGVREGQVGGIIKSEEMLHYSGFTLDRVREILKYVLPKYVMRSDVAIIADAIIEELRMGKDEASPSPSRGGVTRTPRKKNTKQD